MTLMGAMAADRCLALNQTVVFGSSRVRIEHAQGQHAVINEIPQASPHRLSNAVIDISPFSLIAEKRLGTLLDTPVSLCNCGAEVLPGCVENPLKYPGSAKIFPETAA